MPENMQNPFCLSIPSAELPPGQGEPGEAQDLAPGWVSVQPDGKARSGRRSWGWLEGGMDGEGQRQRTAHGWGRGGFTVWGRGCWQPQGQRGGARRVVCWPQTKPRGVGAIVPGTSLCGEAGRRNTSRGETLWERSTVSRASWTCVLSVSHGPLPTPGLGGVSLLPSPSWETQPHPWVGVWG